MNYALISTVTAVDDRGKLRAGAQLLAKMAHRHGIPITWAVTPADARTLAKDITAWHTKFGDEPLLMVDIKPLWDANWEKVTQVSLSDVARGPGTGIRDFASGTDTASLAEHLVQMREKLPPFITGEWDKLARAMPWAVPVAAGADWKHHVLLHALAKTGFQCLWGYHIGDAGTDSGAPFGCFYPSAEQHNFSAASAGEAGEIVGVPYQSTPIETLRTALLNDTQVQNINVYLENCAWNRCLNYVEHIDALEVAELGEETQKRLDAYFAHVASTEMMKAVPLSEIAREYRANCQRTEPTCLYAAAEKSLLYYDAECQLTFTEGTMEPVDMKNYVALSAETSDGTVYHLPKVTQMLPSRRRSELHIALTLESTKAMPYGVTLWGDHGGLRLAKSNAESVTWIGEHLLFARLALQPGNNEFEIILTI